VPVNLFRELSNLKSVSLRNNSLISLPTGLFSELTNL